MQDRCGPRSGAHCRGQRSAREGVENELVSFDLAVLAVDEPADAAAALVMFKPCNSRNHDEGELDERIAGFYEQLRSRFPDHPPYPEDSPWMSMPLARRRLPARSRRRQHARLDQRLPSLMGLDPAAPLSTT